MKLSCYNVGKIKQASIEVNSISLIAGLNNTGKSTVGKALFSLFNSFYDVERKSRNILEDNINKIFRVLLSNFFFEYTLKGQTIIKSTIDELLEKRQTITDRQVVADIIEAKLGDNFFKSNSLEIERIFSILKLSQTDINKNILQNMFKSEFQGQIQNFNSTKKAIIELQIKDKLIRVSIEGNNIVELENPADLTHEAIYLDDPFILDSVLTLRYTNPITHKENLARKLMYNRFEEDTDSLQKKAINDLLLEGNLKNIYAQLDKVCIGELERESTGKISFKTKNDKKELSITNLSTGLKTFTIIKTLLQNGYLEEKGTIILDEPEIHLHPDWQLLLAKIIVLLQKEYHLHVLINSHSPYFIRAIEVYIKQENIEGFKFYLTEEESNGDVTIQDVSDDLEPIYKLLYRSLQELENLNSDFEN